LTYPANLPIYGVFPGFYTETFWVEE